MTSVSVLMAIGVNSEGYREILGAAESASENKECWKSFLKSLKERGLKGVRLFTSDKHLGFLESASEVYPDAKWQRCAVHFFRNVFTKVPRNKFAAVAVLLKATYAQEDVDATLAKTKDVEHKLREMKLNSAADVYAKGVRETLTYLGFPHEHWRNIRTNNILGSDMKTCKHVFASLALRRFSGRGIGPYACLRKAKACCFEGMGHQDVPEHETPIRAGKGKRTETGTGKYRKEGKCSLDLMLEQTLRYFCEKPLTLPRSRTETATIFNHHLQCIGQLGLTARADFIIHQALQHRESRWPETLVRLVGIEFKRLCDKQNNN